MSGPAESDMPPLFEGLGLRVLVPMKPLALAKMRLAPDIDDTTRQAVALMMMHHVAGVAAEAAGGGNCWVVGGDALVREVAQEQAVSWQQERGQDMNSSVSLALMGAWSAGAKGVLVVSADLPMATAADLMRLIDASDGLTRPVGAMAVADGGTNAMLWPAGVSFPPAFGERSFARFQAFTAAAGSPMVAVPTQGLAFDVDSPRDLEYARGAVPGFADAMPSWVRRVQTWSAQNAPRPAWADALEEDDDVQG